MVTSQFTIYQLTNTILYDLPKRIQLHKPKVIVISGLLDQFLQPYLHPAEVESLVSQIVKSLYKMKGVLLVLTSRFDDNNIEFPSLSKIIEVRAKKEFNVTKLNLSIRNNSRLRKASMTETELRID